MPDDERIIDIVGEGVTDLGVGGDRPCLPTSGVLPILVHGLCGHPNSMKVRRRKAAFLMGRGQCEKLRFAMTQYRGSRGVVYVVDTDGDHPGRIDRLRAIRDSIMPAYPAVVGVAHPCIEAWLLGDPKAIRRAFGLPQPIAVTETPEELPATKDKTGGDPKAVLGRCLGRSGAMPADKTTRIALQIRDYEALHQRCPKSFTPFADEVIERIKPIFETNG